MTHRVDPNQTSTAGALSDLTHSLGRKGRASTPVPGRRTDGNYMPVRMRDGQRAKPGVRCGCSAPVLHRHELGSQRSRSFQGQASASVPAPLRSTGQDLDVALHLNINVAQPAHYCRTTRSSRSVGGDVGAAMAKLIYPSNVSLDGCTEDERGAFDWATPDDDVFAFITNLMRSADTYLYGRRMYDTMAVWETDAAVAAQSDLMGDFANVWQAADKVVYSTTLAAVSTANTRLEPHFDPGAVHDLKAAASSDLIVGGPNLAAQALKAGLVDECHLFIWPVVLGGGKPALPTDTRAEPELLDEGRFSNGVVHLRYRPL